jgi:AcrR family transcriptional regulator
MDDGSYANIYERSCYLVKVAQQASFETRTRVQRSDGIRSREAILDEAARLATVAGLDGLSIGRLADAVGMSKSGLYAHFRSKEELQLATIETARSLFFELVVEPAEHAPTGLARLRRLTDGFLDYVEGGVYPGGCFFASVGAELDTRPGRVRDLAISVSDRWIEMLADAIREARAERAINALEDAEQLAFDLNAYLLLANAQFVAHKSPAAIARAKTAIATRLAAAGASTD